MMCFCETFNFRITELCLESFYKCYYNMYAFKFSITIHKYFTPRNVATGTRNTVSEFHVIPVSHTFYFLLKYCFGIKNITFFSHTSTTFLI